MKKTYQLNLHFYNSISGWWCSYMWQPFVLILSFYTSSCCRWALYLLFSALLLDCFNPPLFLLPWQHKRERNQIFWGNTWELKSPEKLEADFKNFFSPKASFFLKYFFAGIELDLICTFSILKNNSADWTQLQFFCCFQNFLEVYMGFFALLFTEILYWIYFCPKLQKNHSKR